MRKVRGVFGLIATGEELLLRAVRAASSASDREGAGRTDRRKVDILLEERVPSGGARWQIREIALKERGER
jgi:hypothetical protein